MFLTYSYSYDLSHSLQYNMTLLQTSYNHGDNEELHTSSSSKQDSFDIFEDEGLPTQGLSVSLHVCLFVSVHVFLFYLFISQISVFVMPSLAEIKMPYILKSR